MQKLHLVGFTTDHKSLILSARRGARSGGYMLAVDDALAEAVASAMHQDGGAEPEDELVFEELPPPQPQSALSVKEVQARLRAGRTIESVAAEAGVDAEWVSRFAAPVLAEQARVVDDTRNATFSRPRLGPSALRLGPSVYRNLVDKGLTTPVDELDKGWSARQRADGQWLVTFRYVSRGRKQKASWEIDLRTHAVRAADRLGAELAYVPGAPKPASPAAKPTKVPATGATDHDRTNARRVAEARKAAEAQLAESARRGAKRSAELAKRAATPRAAAARARRAAAASSAAPPEPPEPAPPADEPTEAVLPLELLEREELAWTKPEGWGEPAAVEPAADAPELPAAVEPLEPPSVQEQVLLVAETASVVERDDPAASAVAMVREAAEALLSDFAAGRLREAELQDDPPASTWESSLEDVPAARAVPTRRRRPPPAPAPEAPTDVAEPPGPAAVAAIGAVPARPTRAPVFRDDLVAPATNGRSPIPPAAPVPVGSAPPRRRRSEPLRAR